MVSTGNSTGFPQSLLKSVQSGLLATIKAIFLLLIANP
jgi:hypothetical protein